MLKAKILTLAALVVLMSNIYVGRAQLELAWENTNYIYQSFNRYKKVIQAEGCLVDMKTGKIIYKNDTLGFFLSQDGSLFYTRESLDKIGDTTKVIVYNFETFKKLDSFKFSKKYNEYRLHGITPDNNIAYYHDQKSAVIFWDIKTRQIVDTIHYKNPVLNVITSPSNEEFTHDGRYMAFQYHTISDQGISGEYFVILDLQTSERVYAKYIGNGFSYKFMNGKNIMLYPEKIHDSIKKADNYYLQYFDLDTRKISKSINFESLGFGLACIKHDDSKILLNTTGYNYRFFDLNSEKLSDFIFSPQNGMLNSMRVIFADDSLIYAKNAAFKIDWTVGIDNQSNELQEIVVFPNPAGSFINLKLPDNIVPKKWEIIDIRGNVLLKNINSISNDLKIDITQLAPEPYILRIYTDKTVLNHKIIKQ